MKRYIKNAIEQNVAYDSSGLQKAADDAKWLKHNIGSVLNDPRWNEPRYNLTSKIIESLESDPNSDGIARLCFAVIDPKTKQVTYATDGDLLFYAVSDSDYYRNLKRLGYENLIVKTLYVGLPNNSVSLSNSSDPCIRLIYSIARKLKSEFRVDPQLVTDQYGSLLLEINDHCDLYVVINSRISKPSVEVDRSGAPFTRFFLKIPADFSKNDMSQAFNKLYPKICEVLGGSSTIDVTSKQPWPDVEFWNSIDLTDLTEFEDACMQYLNKYMDSVETKLQVSCIPSTQGNQGSIDIYDESGSERFEAVDVSYSDWADDICNIAAESTSGRSFQSNYMKYIKSLIGLN